MKLAVTSTGRDLGAKIDPRFGRAPYFIVVDSETMAYSVVNNSQSLNLPQGAGIQAAALVAQHRPSAVITGNCGPKAYHTLQAAGIPVLLGVDGPVRQAVDLYRQGKLTEAPGPNVQGHW